jgi:membrane protease YdiL (CAAX protease family)
MSIAKKSAVFLLLTFAISWAIAIGGHYSGLKDSMGAAGPTIVLATMMAGPAIAALICAVAFEKGRRVQALGLTFKPSIWWLFAWLIPIAISYAALGVTLLLTDQTYVDMGEAARRAAEAQGQDLSQMPPFLLSTSFMLVMSLLIGPLINTPILTFTEELGWRGYLYDLWRPSGFWRASVGTGAIWGVWHAPAIFLYGLNYPTEPMIGAAIFVVFCILLAIIITHVRERTNSVLAAGLMHGTFNAVAGVSIISLSAPEFPWNGVVGIGGLIALAAGAAIIAALRLRTPAVAGAPA